MTHIETVTFTASISERSEYSNIFEYSNIRIFFSEYQIFEYEYCNFLKRIYSIIRNSGNEYSNIRYQNNEYCQAKF